MNVGTLFAQPLVPFGLLLILMALSDTYKNLVSKLNGVE